MMREEKEQLDVPKEVLKAIRNPNPDRWTERKKEKYDQVKSSHVK